MRRHLPGWWRFGMTQTDWCEGTEKEGPDKDQQPDGFRVRSRGTYRLPRNVRRLT